MKKLAFTLAEVLIVIGIIGIIADMTIPNLKRDIDKQVALVQLKKTYSLLNQALKMSEVDNGNHQTWDNSSADLFYENYLKPYMKVTTEYKNKLVPNYKTPKTLSKRLYTSAALVNIDYPKFTTPDGVLYSLGTNGGLQQLIYVDINGLKSPNTFGKDIFGFTVRIDNPAILLPFGVSAVADGGASFGPIIPSRDVLRGASTSACNKTGSDSGLWCTALILVDGWKIASDYPW